MRLPREPWSSSLNDMSRYVISICAQINVKKILQVLMFIASTLLKLQTFKVGEGLNSVNLIATKSN